MQYAIAKDSDGDPAYLIIDNNIYECEVFDTDEEMEEEVATSKAPVARAGRTCSLCNKPGHRKDTCPDNPFRKGTPVEDLA